MRGGKPDECIWDYFEASRGRVQDSMQHSRHDPGTGGLFLWDSSPWRGLVCLRPGLGLEVRSRDEALFLSLGSHLRTWTCFCDTPFEMFGVWAGDPGGLYGMICM